ncbi:MAG: AGE family epimerase/isomerase [Acidobacteria bacterium]|nr:AGE family epimerase/isomerase [Acidobacteriota bacterium]
MRTVSVIAACLVGASLCTAQEAGLQAKFAPRLEKILAQNISPFWQTKSLDRKHGGYTINFGPRSEPRGEGTKMIVTQARMVWFFARMARAGRDVQRNLDAAEHGYRFLKEKMWDPDHGGFYWEVDATGTRKLRPRKHLYGQSFGLYAVSEYYLARGRKDVLDFATRIFDVLESRSHDKTHGGYVEFFNEDWTVPPENEISYMGTRPSAKLMNTHLHLMEAMTTFYRASKLPRARERLIELIAIQSNAVVRKDLGACTDRYLKDWTPILDGDAARVSYGHDIENVWLLMDACEAAGIPVYPLMDLFKALWQYSLRHGYDPSAGGFFDSGRFRQAADRLNKVWWVQSEAIVSALYMYRFTHDPLYLEIFDKTLHFIETRLIDWTNGEWHEFIKPDGSVGGSKAHAWKAGYHNGRAMIECLRLLD